MGKLFICCLLRESALGKWNKILLMQRLVSSAVTVVMWSELSHKDQLLWLSLNLPAQISMVSCQKGPTRRAYAWQIGPFWQDTIDICWYIWYSGVNCWSKHSTKLSNVTLHHDIPNTAFFQNNEKIPVWQQLIIRDRYIIWGWFSFRIRNITDHYTMFFEGLYISFFVLIIDC